MSAEQILVTWLGGAAGSLELAAALAVVAAHGRGPGMSGAVLIDLGDRAPPRPAILASAAARDAEQALGGVCGGQAAARGRTCHLRLPCGREGVELAGAALAAVPGRPLCVLHAAPELLRPLLDCPALRPGGVVLRVDLEHDRSLTALTAGELSARGLRVRVAKRPPGWLAGRMALAGLPPGAAAERAAGQLLSGVLGRRRPGESKRSLGMIVEC